MPPTLAEVAEAARRRPYGLNAEYAGRECGHREKRYKEPGKRIESAEEYQKALSDLVHALFAAHGYTTHLVKTQELMLAEFAPTDFWFDVEALRGGQPEPPVDIRAPLVCLYAILTAGRLETALLPALVSPRVCQLVEAAFWLTHAVVFADAQTRRPCGAARVNAEKFDGQAP